MGMVIGLGVAYVLGSVPTGYWFAKGVKGLDIREHGSGNIGATNVGRMLGKRWGTAVLILDIFKGTLAVVLGQVFFYRAPAAISLDMYKIFCAIAAVCGHNWTLFLGFKGGKGVATSAGALLGVAPLLLVLSAVVWGLVAKMSGYICVASMSSAAAFCLLTFLFRSSLEIRMFGLMLAVMLVAKHRGNIQRLRQGTEPKIGRAKPSRAGDAV